MKEKQRLSRRGFLRLGVEAGTAAGFYAAFAGRPLMPEYTVSEREAAVLRSAAGIIRNDIHTDAGVPYQDMARRGMVYPNAEAFAQAMLFFAFSEEGQAGMERAARFIQDRKMRIGFGEMPGASATTQVSMSPQEPVRMTFGKEAAPLYLQGLAPALNSSVQHEAYHAWANAKYGDDLEGLIKASSIINAAWNGVGIVGGAEVGANGARVVFDRIGLADKQGRVTRRTFSRGLAKAAGGIFGAKAGLDLMEDHQHPLNPFELQAIVQAESAWGKANHPFLKKLHGTYFVLQPE